MTMIVVTHEMAFARQVGTRLIYMEDGRISVDGDPTALLANPENPRLREFLQHVH
jgi:glutamine transport system ATP-binding protein